MSALVEKVKDVVRNRSRHRQTQSIDSAGSRHSSDQYGTSERPPSSGTNLQDGRRGRVSGDHDRVDDTTKSFAAMNVNSSPSTATDSQLNTLPPLPINATQNIENARAHNGVLNENCQQERPLDGSTTTPQTPQHQRNISGTTGGSGNQHISPDIVPDRESSMKRKPVASRKRDSNPRVLNEPPTEQEGKAPLKGPRSPRSRTYSRNADVAPNAPSTLAPHFTTRSTASPTSPTFSPNGSVAGETHSKDLRLPANFDLNNTERTHVDTKIMPAVTQENIHIHRTEVITQAVHRDVHIDHHYTYVQPIPVREVLPARHFQLDPATGIKTEIAAPVGYELPAHLQPHKAEEYSDLKQTTRHYVVDRDHPHGQLENPPFRPEGDYSNLQGEQNQYRNGSARV